MSRYQGVVEVLIEEAVEQSDAHHKVSVELLSPTEGEINVEVIDEYPDEDIVGNRIDRLLPGHWELSWLEIRSSHRAAYGVIINEA